MVGPSVEQKQVLSQQFSAMDPQQWIVMMKWNLERLTEDQSFLMSLLYSEAERRADRDRSIGVGQKSMHAHLIGVMKDLGLKIVVAG